MKTKVSCKGIDKVEAEAVVLLFFKNERPLKGASGLVDWRMNGMISRLIIAGRISGEKGESVLLAPDSRIVSNKILMVGLGESSCFSEDDLENTAANVLHKLMGMGVKNFVIAPPPRDSISFDPLKAGRSIVQGMSNMIREANVKVNDISATLEVGEMDFYKLKQFLDS